MKRFLILFLAVSVMLSFIAISLESIPVQEFPEHSGNIKIFLDIAGDEELKPLVEEHFLEAFSRAENINAVLEIEKGVSYVVSIVLVEARVGEDRRKTGNIVACVQYIDYFDNSILKPDVAVSNWERVNDLTVNLIEHSQAGLYLFPKNDLGNVASGVVAKFQKLFLEARE